MNTAITSEPLFTNKQLKRLLIPLMIEQLLALSIGLFDTVMVSSLGEAAISGVSLVDAINALLIQLFAALATGGAVVTSQYIGKRAPKDAKTSANQLMLITLVFSLVITIVVVSMRTKLLYLIFGAIEDDVMASAQTYFLVSAFSYPFIGLYNAGAALFRAQGNSKVSMLSSLSMNVVNVAGNALLIFGFGLGVLGAAIASLIARVVSCLVVLYLLQMPLNTLRVDSLRALLPNWPYIKKILAIAVPSGIENGMFQFGRLAVSGLTSTLGTAAIAANAICCSLVTILNVPCTAIGLSLITVVGRCLGAGEKGQAKEYSKRLLRYAIYSIWITNIPFMLVGRFTLSLFNLSAEAIDISVVLLLTYNLVSLVFFTSSFAVPNALRSAGDAKFTMWVSVFSMWAFRVVSSYWLVGLGLGMLGVWCGMYIDWAFRSVLFVWRYFSWKWLDKKVI